MIRGSDRIRNLKAAWPTSKSLELNSTILRSEKTYFHDNIVIP